MLDKPRLDNTHIEFVELANLADQANNSPLLFDTLAEHTLKYFEQEGLLMTKTAFPRLRSAAMNTSIYSANPSSFANA